MVRTCHWYAETKFPAGVNLVQTAAPDWRQIESLMALDLIIIPAVTALTRADGEGRDLKDFSRKHKHAKA